MINAPVTVIAKSITANVFSTTKTVSVTVRQITGGNTDGMHTIFISSSQPTDGKDGDIWAPAFNLLNN